MQELLKQREDVLNKEIESSVFNKIIGISDGGNQVKIHWKDRDYFDEGYLFTLPEMAQDEGDVFVHIPKPDNSDGMGEAPEVHIHLLELASFDRVLKIECSPKQ